MKTLLLTAAACIFAFTGTDVQAQHWRHNEVLQRHYDNSYARSLHIAAGHAYRSNHHYLGSQGYSNAMQIAYDQAYSQNFHTRWRGIHALEHIGSRQHLSNNPHGRFIRQTAHRAYHEALDYHGYPTPVHHQHGGYYGH